MTLEEALADEEWQTWFVTDPNKPGPTYKAKELLE